MTSQQRITRKHCPQEQNQAVWEMMLTEWEPKENKQKQQVIIFFTLSK